MLCFSSVPVFLKYFAADEFELDFWTVNAVRYSVAALFWLPFVVVLSRRFKAGTIRPAGGGHAERPARSIWVAALVPATVNTIGQIGWGASHYAASASTVGFVIRTSFLFTIMLGFIFIPAERALGRRGAFYLGVAISMVGVALLVMGLEDDPGMSRETTWVGLALLTATAVFWGAYVISVRKFLSGYPLRLAFGVISLYTAATLLTLMAAFGRYEKLAALPPKVWALLLVSGFIGIAIAHVLYYRGIHGMGPVVANGITLGGPFVTAMLAAMVLSERMTAMQLLGGVTVVVGGGVLVWVKGAIERAGPELPRAGR